MSERENYNSNIYFLILTYTIKHLTVGLGPPNKRVKIPATLVQSRLKLY